MGADIFFFTDVELMSLKLGVPVIPISAAKNEGVDELNETAKMLIDMAGSEAMIDVRVAYGSIIDEIKGVMMVVLRNFLRGIRRLLQ